MQNSGAVCIDETLMSKRLDQQSGQGAVEQYRIGKGYARSLVLSQANPGCRQLCVLQADAKQSFCIPSNTLQGPFAVPFMEWLCHIRCNRYGRPPGTATSCKAMKVAIVSSILNASVYRSLCTSQPMHVMKCLCLLGFRLPCCLFLCLEFFHLLGRAFAVHLKDLTSAAQHWAEPIVVVFAVSTDWACSLIPGIICGGCWYNLVCCR